MIRVIGAQETWWWQSNFLVTWNRRKRKMLAEHRPATEAEGYLLFQALILMSEQRWTRHALATEFGANATKFTKGSVLRRDWPFAWWGMEPSTKERRLQLRYIQDAFQ